MSDKRCGMLHYFLNFLYNFLFISVKILVTNLFGGKCRLSSDLLGMNYKISVYSFEWRVGQPPSKERRANYLCHSFKLEYDQSLRAGVQINLAIETRLP